MKRLDGFLAWWKRDGRALLLGKAILMALLPLLCCIVTCAVQGRRIGEVYLPMSEWNDELFYYKQVEGIVNYGFPQGYFGFNESHALKLSFAAWSPVLVLPWIIWGLLFGWNLMSPVICNILLMTVAVFLFVWLTKPTWKQLGILTLLFCLYTPFVRYMLSGMPEVICFSHLIVFYAVAVSYRKKEQNGKIAVLFFLSGLLTLMRPYMLLFMLLPAYFLVMRGRKNKKVLLAILISGGVICGVLAVYAAVKHYLGAEYFAPLFFTDWVTIFFREGIGAGVHNFFSTLYWKGKGFWGDTVEGLRSGLASGAFFAGYLTTMCILLWQSFADWRKQKKEKSTAEGNCLLAVEAHLAFSFVAMLFALLLMYKLTEGSKHLLTFMAVGVFVISLMETKFYKKAVFLGACFAYLYTYMAVDPYDYQVPFAQEQRVRQVEGWRDVFEREIVLSTEKVPNYDNVVIWVFDEKNPETEALMRWQLLYALPAGCGISCCQKEFVSEHFEELQSRYIAVFTGKETDLRCAESGCRKIAGDDAITVYQLR